MAYLAVKEKYDVAHAPQSVSTFPRPAPKASPSAFSALEWSVVMLARHDRPSTLHKSGHKPGQKTSRIGQLIDTIFGKDINRGLANPKLESLRRMAVLVWHPTHKVTPAQIDEFLAAGYTSGHHVLLGQYVAEVLGSPVNNPIHAPSPGQFYKGI